MSALRTYSKFYYGIQIDDSNNKIDFDEGAGPLVATLNFGAYTITSIAVEVARALNEAGVNTYSATVSRTTRLMTITVDASTDLLWQTGANASLSAGPTLGFAVADDTDTSFVGSTAIGSTYSPQFVIQDFIPSNNFVRAAYSTVSKSASGRVSVQKFGEERFLEMNFKFVTDITQPSNSVIRDSATATEDLRDFMSWLIQKKQIQFMKDENDPSTFETIILESTPDSQDGTGYRLRELYDQGLPYYFETGVMKFRVFTED